MSAWYKSDCHIDTSLWGKTAKPLPDMERLEGDVTSDVVVIGGGFTGLSAALHLAEMNIQVTLIEAHEPGWGASGRNGGQVIPGLKIQPHEIVARYGTERGEAIAATAGAAPALVFDIIDRYGIDADLRRAGWIQLAKGPQGRKVTDKHVEVWGHRGAPVRALEREEVESMTGANGYLSGLIDERGGNLHPLKYARGLARAALSRGARIFRDTPALGVERTNESWIVTTEAGSVRAETVIVATNGYTGDMLPGLSESVVPVLTGVVATDPLSDNLKARILPGRQAAADTQRLLSWFGLDAEGRLIFGSRINRQDELIDDANFAFGIRRMREIFPDVNTESFSHMWTGRVALTLDHVPHIHNLGPGLYAGLGYNGRGVAMATMFGKVLAGHVVGDKEVQNFLPVTRMPKVPMSMFRGAGLTIALTWKRMMDTLAP